MTLMQEYQVAQSDESHPVRVWRELRGDEHFILMRCEECGWLKALIGDDLFTADFGELDSTHSWGIGGVTIGGAIQVGDDKDAFVRQLLGG